MMRVLLCVALLACGAVAAVAMQPAAATFQPAQLREFARSQLTIERRNGRDTFQIWLAETSAQQQQGLMWIRQLPADYGMLFVLGETRPMSMWMKNTYVSLDMLFVEATGRITHIVHRATPLSEEFIYSNGGVAGVLEIAGGEAQRRGIIAGDRILHAAFPISR
jgi:uncharacterized protein